MTLLAEAEARSEHGCGYPAHIRREFSRYLACGQYARGFLRQKCSDCGFERLLPFSCKGRALCPSCMARRMADVAAYLVDHLLPLAPYRQWTLSPPHDIRLLVIRNPDLLSYHGIFAANAMHRADLQILIPHQGFAPLPPIGGSQKKPAPRRYKHRWMDLLERVFGHDLSCPQCHGPMQVIQVVEDPVVSEKILPHLGLPTSLPPVSPARAPPDSELDLCFAQTVPQAEPDWLD